MTKFLGYLFAMTTVAGIGAGCAGTPILTNEQHRLTHELHVMEWKFEQMVARNAALRQQVDAFHRAVDARDMEFYSSRIPGNRAGASFQE